jgi:hypothetical protein
MRHRDTHYFLWFIFFGLLAGLIHYVNSPTFDPESTWLAVSGLLGILLGQRWALRGRLERGYDLVIGVIFTLAGALGIIIGFTGQVASLTSHSALVGLSLGVLSSLLHTVLGLTSLNHGLRNK